MAGCLLNDFVNGYDSLLFMPVVKGSKIHRPGTQGHRSYFKVGHLVVDDGHRYSYSTYFEVHVDHRSSAGVQLMQVVGVGVVGCM